MMDLIKLKSGDRRALSKTISMIESGEINSAIIKEKFPNIKTAEIWAITGSPGVGKSCICEYIIGDWLKNNQKIAVLAVDPSSPLSGGALLGDRIRINNSDNSDNIFFRSLATRGQSGAIPSNISDILDLLSALNFEKILIETVGAGQAEVRVAAVSQYLLLVEAPDSGDMLQAEKAGLMELADILLVNKSDLERANEKAEQLSLAFQLSSNHSPPILMVSAKQNSGFEELFLEMEKLSKSGKNHKIKSRISLSFAWENLLWNHKDVSKVLEKLESEQITLDEAINHLKEEL
ncbi:MAG: methylmalonyl Co-A mutase-associated GTPase MeaB [Euryarchaeota archaeon]|nr:methylmalonyl Co-A mutase-associated GTPase MeaB [Euryarchaeota archaeon]|tara:strand:- start:6890 stop:7765 length:876 start_codon:yes stop_codon:yes gene_type:complete